MDSVHTGSYLFCSSPVLKVVTSSSEEAQCLEKTLGKKQEYFKTMENVRLAKTKLASG